MDRSILINSKQDVGHYKLVREEKSKSNLVAGCGFNGFGNEWKQANTNGCV